MNISVSDGLDYILNRLLYDFLVSLRIGEPLVEYLNTFLLIAIVLAFMFGLHLGIRFLLRKTLKRVDQRSSNNIFMHLLNNRLPHYLAFVAPVIVLKNSIGIIFYGFPKWIPIFHNIIDAYIVLMIVWLLMSILSAGADALKEHPTYKSKPLDSYLQVIRMILLLYAIIILFSMFTGKSPVAFFTAMGAMSAVLLLMFKDTIMGFVASIQVTTNDMVRIGDWIEMPKYGADGDVIEINLTTVKVQNWDKTITMVPTYALISDSFQNWRGMQESGGRRLKRAIHLKQSTVRFIQDDELERFQKIQGIKDYIIEKSKEIHQHNKEIGANTELSVNGRSLTNLGLFRKYAEWYLLNHPGVRNDMTFIVRQLAPTDRGLPLEVYVFAATINWVEYEGIAGDVFDHLLASVKYFDLEIFESSTNKMRIVRED